MPAHQRRSRTGCATCKRRRKKCPEEFQNGSCLRCLEGGFDCILDSHTAATKSPPASRKPPSQPKASNARSPTPLTPHAVALISNRAGHDIQRAPSTEVLPSQREHTPSSAFLASISALSPIAPLENSASDGAFESFDVANSLKALIPGVFTPPPGDIRLPSPSLGWIGDLRRPSDVSDLGELGEVIPWRRDRASPKNEDPLTKFYHLVMESWFYSLPDRLSRTLLEHYSAISDLHQVTRSARDAVSSAYIVRLKRRSRFWPGTVKFKRGNPNPAETLDSEFQNSDPDPETLFRKAMTLIRTTEPEPGLSLEAKLWAIMDLQLAHLVLYGAEGMYPTLELADELIRAAFGPNPSLDLASLQGYSTFSLRVFALADIVRSIAHRTTTTFNLIYRPDLLPSQDRDAECSAYDNFLGLPQSLAVLMAAVTNLCAGVWTAPGQRPSPEVLEAVKRLESQIRAWRPLSPEVEGQVQSANWVEKVSLQECWRLVAIILIYTVILRLGPLHPVVRDCYNQVLALIKTSMTLSTLMSTMAVDMDACFSACPAFLAATLASRPEDRKVFQIYIESLGAEKVWEDNLQVLRLCWEQSDSQGMVLDWFVVAKRAGLDVAFF